jgi:hypothetical protein
VLNATISSTQQYHGETGAYVYMRVVPHQQGQKTRTSWLRPTHRTCARIFDVLFLILTYVKW